MGVAAEVAGQHLDLIVAAHMDKFLQSGEGVVAAAHPPARQMVKVEAAGDEDPDLQKAHTRIVARNHGPGSSLRDAAGSQSATLPGQGKSFLAGHSGCTCLLVGRTGPKQLSQKALPA